MKSPNLPQCTVENLPPTKVHQIITSIMELYSMGKPQTDEEVSVRIDEYFRLCEASNLRPGVESISTALHISRITFYNWSNGVGCSKQRQELILAARSFIDAFLEQSMLQGAINPASGIFLLKNWCNYKDAVSIEQSIPKQPEAPPQDAQSIAARYGLTETNLQNFDSESEVF